MPRMDSSHADAWIVIDGRKMLGIYRAEAPDGSGYLMKYSREQHSSIAWVPRHLVDFIRPVTPVYRQPAAPAAERLRRQIAAAQDGATTTADA